MPVGAHRLGSPPEYIAASSLPTAVELTHTRSYLRAHSRFANPVKGTLYERRIWPQP
jgi:hypothetical protein